MKIRLSSLLVMLAVCLMISISCFCETENKGMSLNDAGHVANLLLKDKNYYGQVIEAYSKQLDRNFYGFQMIRDNQSAGNFEFTTLDVNRFTGAVWLVVGSNCSLYASPALKERQNIIKKKLSVRSKTYEKLDSIKPMFCSDSAI